jgi:hypothetical protein
MKKTVVSLALLGLLALVGQAGAAICTIDEVPAATLLLPYFEVDLSTCNTAPNPGTSTLFSINNASATAVLAHVVVWSDWSVHVLDFNVYLTGYDVQTINLCDILVSGKLPQTASAGQDPTDTISPKGSKSQDINFASCTGQLPTPTLSAGVIGYLQAALTGKPNPLFTTPSDHCFGNNYGDNIARGYITVDTVNNCTLKFPEDPGYFVNGGAGDATNQNVLWGDYFYVNLATNRADGNPLVHIEASPGVGVNATGFNTYPAPGSPATTTPGRYTFYGRYDGWSAADNREPLATSFATRYVNGGTFTGGTNLVVWRDSKSIAGNNTGGFVCGTTPPWFPLGQEGLVIFDEQEHPQTAQTNPVSGPPGPGTITPFPIEAQSVKVNGPSLPVPFPFGWMYLNLNTTVASGAVPGLLDPAAAQAWVETVMSALGRFSVGFDAVQLDSACNASHFTP